MVDDALGVPAELVDAQARNAGEAGRAFVAALPGRAADYLARWELRRTGAAMFGVCALVLPVVCADGTPAVLKLQALDAETAGEPVALRAWGGDGAVRLLRYDGATGTLLLERLDPARDLGGVESREAVLTLAGLLARLSAVPAPAGLRGLGDAAARMLGEVAGAAGALRDEGERRLVLDCAAVLREVADAPGDRLLHWDLHFGNVLAAEREPWLAIDPKPLAGDPGFELLPALSSRFDASETVWRFDAMTEVLGLDRGRARAWTVARVLQNSLWRIRGGEHGLDPVQTSIAWSLLAR